MLTTVPRVMPCELRNFRAQKARRWVGLSPLATAIDRHERSHVPCARPRTASSKRRRTAASIQSQERTHPKERFVDAVDHVAGYPIVDHFGHRAVPERQNGRAAGHRLDHDQAEWLRPVDGKEQRPGIAEEFAFAAFVDFADVFDTGQAEQRPDFASRSMLRPHDRPWRRS